MMWTWIGGLSGFLSVAMGAFGAHALASRVDAKMLQTYHLGAQYQMYHALALVALGIWASQHPETSVGLPGWAFVIGTVLFSGSLYVLTISGVKMLGMITPFGGISFMLGWLSFAWLAWKASVR